MTDYIGALVHRGSRAQSPSSFPSTRRTGGTDYIGALVPGASRRTEVEIEQPRDNNRLKELGRKVFNQGGKFLARTAVEASNLLASTLDFSADFLAGGIDGLIHNKTFDKLDENHIKGYSSEPTDFQKKLLEKWQKFYSQTGGESTEKVKLVAQNLRKIDYIQPSKEWQEASTQEKLTNRLGETVLNIGPGIVSSLGLFALNPYLGFSVSVGATADDVKTVAEENGLEKDRAELLGLGTGLLVGWLDRLVPDEVFSPTHKNGFIKGFVKRIVKSGLKEAGTEIAQEDIQILAEATVREDLGVDEVVERNLMSGLGGLLGGSGAETSVRFVNEIRRGGIVDAHPDKKMDDPSNIVEKVSREAKNSLENDNSSEKAGSVERARQDINSRKDIKPVEIRKTDEGDVVIVDGRHRLEASRLEGINIGIEDVTKQFNKNYEGDLTQELLAQKFDFGSTQFNLPTTQAEEVRKFGQSIPDKDLYTEDGDRAYGREFEPHITVLYGLNEKNDSKVRNIVESFGEIEVELSDVSVFENESYDVLKVNIKSKKLSELYKKLDSEIEAPGKTFDDYKPHITIAYLKKGLGKKYAGNSSFNGKKLLLNDLVFSGKDGVKTTIPLSSKKSTKETQKTPEKKLSRQPKKASQETGDQSAQKKPKKTDKKKKERKKGATKASKVAVSIEQKLSKKLESVAGFESINIKDQLKRAEELLNNNLIRARGMISGKIPLPEGLRAGAFIKAVEEYANQTNDTSLLRSLAISPLVSESSIHAQELRLLAERDQSSVLSKMQDIASERAKVVEKKHKKSSDNLIKGEVKKIKKSIKKPNKYDWNQFIQSIEC